MLISILMIILNILLMPIAYADIHRKGRYPGYLVMCLVLLVLAYIRTPLLGADSLNNFEAYNHIMQGWQLSYGRGYILFVKIIQAISKNYRFFLVITATVIMVPFYLFLRHYKYRFLALMLFSLSLYIATFDVLKGYLAYAMLLMGIYAYFHAKKHKRKIAFILGLLAVLFHPTIILMIVMVLVSMRKTGKRFWAAVYSAGAVFLLPPVRSLLTGMLALFGSLFSSKYALYANVDSYYSTTYNVIFMVVTLLIFVYYDRLMKLEDRSKYINLLINMHLIGQWMALFGGFVPGLSRYLKFIMLFSICIACEILGNSRLRINRTVIGVSMLTVYSVFVVLNNGGLIYTIGW